MPKSKRNKQIDLTKTKKKGFEGKKQLYEEIRNNVDQYANIYIFSVKDMRNNKMKSLREQWKHSRFFIGKNKVMALAFGLAPESEYRPNLHKIANRLKGERGLLFSNKSADEVCSWFKEYSEGDYARSGNTATEEIILKEGPYTQFPHNIEPYLRQLGLPTTLQKGIVHLIKNHELCKVGDILTPETARILKLIGIEMAEFHVTIECHWSQNGSFEDFAPGTTNTEKSKENKTSSVANTINEPMEIAKEKELTDSSADEDIEEEEEKLTEKVEKKTVENKTEKDDASDDITDNKMKNGKKSYSEAGKKLKSTSSEKMITEKKKTTKNNSKTESMENVNESSNLSDKNDITEVTNRKQTKRTVPYISPKERRLRSRTIKLV